MTEYELSQGMEHEPGMRNINTDDIIKTIKEMCIEANYQLASDVEKRVRGAQKTESSQLGKQILNQLGENLDIAATDSIPICQDTGMAIVFVKLGQEVHIEGMNLEEAVNEGIRQGYQEGYLRKSVVSDPLIRNNTKDNTPGIIHYEIIPGNQIELTVAPKGFGSENMSRIYMLKPSDGIEGIKQAVLETVKMAGPNACPPIIVGVGIGGSFEKSALLSKKALTRSLDEPSKLAHIRDLEEELLEEINRLGIGPGGLGGRTTALGVNIETYPTHIAGLPVAINICCHVNRHVTRIL
jgi:fumarate hydratase subunit alpha